MLVITPSQLRSNTKRYFDMIDHNEKVVVRQRGGKTYQLIKADLDTENMSEEEYYAKINESIAQYERGEFTRLEADQSIEDFIKSVCTH